MKNHHTQKETTDELVFGIHPIIETIKAGKTVSKIFLDKSFGSTGNKDLLSLIKEKEIPTSYVPKVKLDSFTKKNHQGVIALISPIDFCDLENIVQASFEKGKMPFILLLNNLTDVRNVGAIVRTADCIGVDAVVVEWSGCALNGDCMKTSAGALARVPICRTRNLPSTISYLQSSGINVAACTEKATSDIYSTNLNQPIAILMGSEGFGIESENLKRANLKMKIPMLGSISSLNVSVSAAVAMYEVLRQRNI